MPVKPKSYKKEKPGGRAFNGRRHITDLYDTAWEKYRFRFLHENPNCYACSEKAVAVDHVVPHKGDIEKFRKLDNHIPLCTRCHNTVTALFDKNHAGEKTTSDKLRWLAAKRYQLGIFTKVKVLPYYTDA